MVNLVNDFVTIWAQLNFLKPMSPDKTNSQTFRNGSLLRDYYIDEHVKYAMYNSLTMQNSWIFSALLQTDFTRNQENSQCNVVPNLCSFLGIIDGINYDQSSQGNEQVFWQYSLNRSGISSFCNTLNMLQYLYLNFQIQWGKFRQTGS